MYIYVTKYDFIIRASMVWAVTERGSTRNDNKDGWRLTVKERAQIAARYEVWNSVAAVQRC